MEQVSCLKARKIPSMNAIAVSRLITVGYECATFTEPASAGRQRTGCGLVCPIAPTGMGIRYQPSCRSILDMGDSVHPIPMYGAADCPSVGTGCHQLRRDTQPIQVRRQRTERPIVLVAARSTYGIKLLRYCGGGSNCPTMESSISTPFSLKCGII